MQCDDSDYLDVSTQECSKRVSERQKHNNPAQNYLLLLSRDFKFFRRALLFLLRSLSPSIVKFGRRLDLGATVKLPKSRWGTMTAFFRTRNFSCSLARARIECSFSPVVVVSNAPSLRGMTLSLYDAERLMIGRDQVATRSSAMREMSGVMRLHFV